MITAKDARDIAEEKQNELLKKSIDDEICWVDTQIKKAIYKGILHIRIRIEHADTLETIRKNGFDVYEIDTPKSLLGHTNLITHRISW